MARNRLAGTTKGNSSSARYYQNHPQARNKKKAYDTKYHSTKPRRKYRALLQSINRKNGTHGNLDSKDESHVSATKTRPEDFSANRGRKLAKYMK